MAENLDVALAEPSEADKRIKQLSGKLKEEAEANQVEKQGREAAEQKVQEVERERDFFAGFADTVATNPAAKDFKDDIKAKVLSGYSLEDATYAVLGKAGKLNQSEPDSPAGGSATTTVTQQGTKSVKEMTPDERAAAIREAADKGDISWT